MYKYTIPIISLEFEVPEPSKMGISEGAYKYKTDTCKDWGFIIDMKTDNEVERKWLKDIMFCESTCREKVDNGQGFKGLYQFNDATWKENCEGDIFNGFAQIDCALKLYRKNQQDRWECKNTTL